MRLGPASSASPMNARDPSDVVHAVHIDDSTHDWGRLVCGERYYWVHRVLSPVEMDELHQTSKPWPANPTRERITCMLCLTSPRAS